MNIITNESLVRRNARIAQYAMLGGLVVLAGGMIVSFQNPPRFDIAIIALVIGFILSQVGIYFTNRWGRRPRPDEMLNQGLKGLDNKYSLYHYTTPASHLLIGPAGIWVLHPRHQRGVITFEKSRWRQRGGGFMMAYLKLFAQEGLGRPDLEMSAEVEKVEGYINQLLPEEEQIPTAQAALIITNEQTEIEIPDDIQPPAPTMKLNQLKDFIRKTAKSKPISMDLVKEIQAQIDEELGE